MEVGGKEWNLDCALFVISVWKKCVCWQVNVAMLTQNLRDPALFYQIQVYCQDMNFWTQHLKVNSARYSEEEEIEEKKSKGLD